VENFRLTKRQIDALKATHRKQRDRRFADRVKAIVLLGSGWSVSEVAEALLVDETTIYNWFEIYCNGGEKELLVMHHQGAEAKLNETQQQELAKHLDENTYLTSKDIRHYVKKTYKAKYSATGMKDLLHRLGFVYKKPKHVPGKLDPEKQKEFVEEYEKLLKTKGKNNPIYFGDASHPQFNSIPAYGWIRRGKEKHLKSNGGRKRVNIHGAVNIETKDIVTDFPKSVTKESTDRLCRKIEAHHPKAKKIHLFIDNASYYTAKWLKEQLKLRKSKIVLHFLPSYSPNLNIIERLWKFLKKKILYNTYYEKYEDFLSACKGFFRCRTKYRAELRSLLSEKFQLFQM
jgi:transposase